MCFLEQFKSKELLWVLIRAEGMGCRHLHWYLARAAETCLDYFI